MSLLVQLANHFEQHQMILARFQDAHRQNKGPGELIARGEFRTPFDAPEYRIDAVRDAYDSTHSREARLDQIPGGRVDRNNNAIGAFERSPRQNSIRPYAMPRMHW